MWRWWVFTFIHNCVWIFWFLAKNAKTPKNSKNAFQWTIKHVVWQEFFLQYDLHFKFEPIEHNSFVKWLKKSHFPCSPFLRNLKTFKFLYNLVFHQVHIMNIYFHRRGMFLSYNFFEMNCMTLCIWFLKKKNAV
jgi:hypothetical protein